MPSNEQKWVSKKSKLVKLLLYRFRRNWLNGKNNNNKNYLKENFESQFIFMIYGDPTLHY